MRSQIQENFKNKNTGKVLENTRSLKMRTMRKYSCFKLWFLAYFISKNKSFKTPTGNYKYVIDRTFNKCHDCSGTTFNKRHI